ncbi:hypothetical protein L6164_026184 [Bauhinia variegata]|uniref:Uncharacterized protein n=1 Tax=Bauhinia variegata TaxID=167791 RepID=A0ACB9LPA6_BAUVA|nr:hypothetical protein L6164_026184 [Bauhinia variegata]
MGFKLWHTRKVRRKNGVGIIVGKIWKKNVVVVKRVEDRILSVKLMVTRETINIINAYAPQVSLEAYLKEKFWEDLEGLVQDIPQEEKILIRGDLDGYVGSETKQFVGAHDGFDFGELNEEGIKWWQLKGEK